MQTALDRSAIYKTVDVQSVNSLSGWTSCAVASCEEDEEEEEDLQDELSHLNHVMLFYSIASIHFKGKYYTCYSITCIQKAIVTFQIKSFNIKQMLNQ